VPGKITKPLKHDSVGAPVIPIRFQSHVPVSKTDAVKAARWRLACRRGPMFAEVASQPRPGVCRVVPRRMARYDNKAMMMPLSRLLNGAEERIS